MCDRGDHMRHFVHTADFSAKDLDATVRNVCKEELVLRLQCELKR